MANFSDMYPEALKLSVKVAEWTIDHMQDASGYYYYRIMPWGTMKVPLLHWGQATMYRALSLLLERMRGVPSRAGIPMAGVRGNPDGTG